MYVSIAQVAFFSIIIQIFLDLYDNKFKKRD